MLDTHTFTQGQCWRLCD